MKCWVRSISVWATCLVGISTADGPLDETWTVTVAGQSVQVNADGTFIISNIAAPDRFGPDGPGSAPDFLSDEFLRLVGVSHAGETPRYLISEYFQIRQGIGFNISELTFSDIPPLSNHSLVLDVDQSVLTEIGQTAQLQTTAVLSDGSTVDVTPRTRFTVYRTSNFNVATVGRDGLVTAVGRGQAYLTAVNESATAVIGVIVSPGDPLTTVDGFVRFDNGTPVAGARVRVFDQFATGVTDADGHYALENVVTTSGPIHVKASVSNGGILSTGAIAGLTPFPAGITDAGIITIAANGADGDNDLLPDILEPALGYDPGQPDTDGDLILDGLEDFDDDGIANCDELGLGTDPSLADSDVDTLDDLDEIVIGTNPLEADTDRDGIIDGEETEFGTDPLDRRSLPTVLSQKFGLATGWMSSLEQMTRPSPNLNLRAAFAPAPIAVENVSAPPPLNLQLLETLGPVLSVDNQNAP